MNPGKKLVKSKWHTAGSLHILYLDRKIIHPAARLDENGPLGRQKVTDAVQFKRSRDSARMLSALDQSVLLHRSESLTSPPLDILQWSFLRCDWGTEDVTERIVMRM